MRGLSFTGFRSVIIEPSEFIDQSERLAVLETYQIFVLFFIECFLRMNEHFLGGLVPLWLNF